MNNHYPRSLYLKGWDDLSATVTVNNPAEEAEAREQGYRILGEEVAAPAETVTATEPNPFSGVPTQDIATAVNRGLRRKKKTAQ